MNSHTDRKIGSSGDFDTTPYSRSGLELETLADSLASSDRYLYIDSKTNPDIGNLAVYKVDGNSGYADLGRSLEIAIFNEDAGYPDGFLEEKFEHYDHNSIFMILMDNSGDKPKLAGALRIIDCSRGESETLSLFKEFFGADREIPPELLPKDDKQTVWDILSVVVLPDYRDGYSSAWLYHGLYEASLQEGVEYWIANMTPKETRNLRDLCGIPFRDIPGVEEVSETNPDGTAAVYGFYSIDVPDIRPSMTSRINELLQGDDGINRIIASIANIALSGSTEVTDK